MEQISDSEGLQIRGMSAGAMSMGTSIVSGFLIDPATKSYVFGTDVNGAMSTAENAGLQVYTAAGHTQASSLALNLNVTTAISSFVGSLTGGAGGAGFAFGQT